MHDALRRKTAQMNCEWSRWPTKRLLPTITKEYRLWRNAIVDQWSQRKAEIERLLQKKGETEFVHGWKQDKERQPTNKGTNQMTEIESDRLDEKARKASVEMWTADDVYRGE
jgi:hypothetical protein